MNIGVSVVLLLKTKII